MSIGSLFDKVEYGTQKRFDCMYCGGKNSLSITKENGKVKYHCFKANCPLLSGSRIIRMNKEELSNVLSSKTLLGGATAQVKPFTMPDYWIQGIASKKAFQLLLNNNALQAYTEGLYKVAYDPKGDRLVYLVESNGAIVGGIGRALSGQPPKVLNYVNSARVPFTCGKGTTAVLVEDCASACSIARNKDYTGIALLGTEIRNEYLFYIVMKYERVIIALDPDAYSKSIKMRSLLMPYCPKTLIWKLKKDLKNMTQQEIQEFIVTQGKLI